MSAREVIGLQVELAYAEGLNMGGREVANRILAALDSAGLAVVPKEPTVEMQTAGTEQWLTVRAMEDRAAVIYRAMLAAAKEGE
jgi:hypothetical protein